jgi:PTS system nitrogen regulatory IIA component
MTLTKALTDSPVSLDLKSDTKEAIITELIDLLDQAGKLPDRDAALTAVQEREKKMSTGMQHGIAIPHGKTGTVDNVVAAVGVKRSGMDFDSIDKIPATIFILTVSPKDRSGPHIRFLAEISRLLDNNGVRDRIVNAGTEEEIIAILTE